jgi:hypothetical protein
MYFLVPGSAIILNLINYHIVGTILFFPGMEYMVKFNLQKHLEQFHTVEERNSNPGDIIKVSMDSYVFMFFLLLKIFSLYLYFCEQKNDIFQC